MEQQLNYWRFAGSLIFYTIYVMLFPVLTPALPLFGAIGVVPALAAGSARLWMGTALAIINYPVTTLLYSRVLSRPFAALLGQGSPAFVVSLGAVIAVSIYASRARDGRAAARTLEDRQRFLSGFPEAVADIAAAMSSSTIDRRSIELAMAAVSRVSRAERAELVAAMESAAEAVRGDLGAGAVLGESYETHGELVPVAAALCTATLVCFAARAARRRAAGASLVAHLSLGDHENGYLLAMRFGSDDVPAPNEETVHAADAIERLVSLVGGTLMNAPDRTMSFSAYFPDLASGKAGQHTGFNDPGRQGRSKVHTGGEA